MSGTVLGGIFGYLFHFAVSRQMSVAQYGELQSLLSVSLIFGVFNSALSYLVVKHTSVFAAHNDRTANLEFTNYFTSKISKYSAVLLATLLIVSPILSRLLHFSSYLGFFVVSFATFLSAITIIYLEVLRGWQKFFFLSFIGVAIVFVKLVAGVSLAALSPKASIVSFSFLASAVIGWYLARYYCEKRILGAERPKGASGWKEKYFSEASLKKTVLKIFVFSLALGLVSNSDILLVKYFSSAETTGFYGAFSLIGKIILWLNLSIVGVMLPGACAEGYSGKRPGKYDLLRSYGLMAIIALVFVATYYLFPGFMIRIFFGKKYLLNISILWMFGIMSYLLSLLTLEANLSFAKHDFRVIYFLAGTFFLMIAGLAKYHASLEQIVLSLSTAFLLGYFSVILLNLSHERKRKKLSSLL